MEIGLQMDVEWLTRQIVLYLVSVTILQTLVFLW